MSNDSTNNTPSYLDAAIARGYIFECPCGELLNSVYAAMTCRKCRKYSSFPGRYVVNVVTEEVVHGTVPSAQEREAALVAAGEQQARGEAFWAQVEAEHAAEAAAAEAARIEALYWAEFFKYDTLAVDLGYKP